MIKSELIARLSEENPHLTQRDVERVVGVILERMIQALEDGSASTPTERLESRQGRSHEHRLRVP
jgi:hypothetical protein